MAGAGWAPQGPVLSATGRMVVPHSPNIYSQSLLCVYRVLGGAGDTAVTESVLALLSWDSQSSGGGDSSVCRQ